MKSECLKRIGLASIALLTFLGVAVAVYAADPYWMGHLWPQGKADYQIAEWTMPSGFSDDIMWGVDKWGEPSSFYLARVELPRFGGQSVKGVVTEIGIEFGNNAVQSHKGSNSPR